MICGSARISSSKMRLERGSGRVRGGVTFHWRREPGGGRVELGADDPDDARLLQPADPVQRRRRGEADQARELDVRAVRVDLQRSEQPYINFIKLNGHISKYYLVSASN